MNSTPHFRSHTPSVQPIRLPLERDLQAWRSASLIGALLRERGAQPRIYRAYPTSVVVKLRRGSGV